MTNKNKAYFFGGAGDKEKGWFIEYRINQETVRKSGNGEGINISMSELLSEISNLENKIMIKEKGITQ